MKKLIAFPVMLLALVYVATTAFTNQVQLNVIDATGLRQGSWKITAAMKKLGPPWSPNQIVEEGVYKNSLRNGVWTEYLQTGTKKSETEYVNDVRNGIGKTYYPNETLQMEMTWTNGRLDGPAKTYYPDGKLCEEGYWKHNYWDMSKPYTFHQR